jgi:CDP-diacylglycerol--glycerol-3-phosphate 3-phosphatidyltransferase
LTLNLPTIITLSRIILIPFFVLIAPDRPFLGALIFGVASITDFLDGYLARKTGQITKFGIILDPIADKFLVISALILLVDMARLSAWIAIAIIVREFLVTGLRAVALSRDIVIPAEMGGKLKTFSQITAILCLIISMNIFGIDLYDVGIVFIWIAMVLSIISGVQYTVSFWKKI